MLIRIGKKTARVNSFDSNFLDSTTAITRDNDPNSCKNEHTHEVFSGQSDAEKETGLQNSACTSQMYHYSKLPAVCIRIKAVQLAVPCRSAINRALNRQMVNERPTVLPMIDRSFETPKQHEDFCVFESGNEAPERVLIWADCNNI